MYFVYLKVLQWFFIMQNKMLILRGSHTEALKVKKKSENLRETILQSGWNGLKNLSWVDGQNDLSSF